MQNRGDDRVGSLHLARALHAGVGAVGGAVAGTDGAHLVVVLFALLHLAVHVLRFGGGGDFYLCDPHDGSGRPLHAQYVTARRSSAGG